MMWAQRRNFGGHAPRVDLRQAAREGALVEVGAGFLADGALEAVPGKRPRCPGADVDVPPVTSKSVG
jgi:hypothetical protein